jgi:hypothetical protein
MPVIVTLVFVVAAAFALIVVVTILVIIGVHQEERYQTFVRRGEHDRILVHGGPPTIPALLARRVLGAYIYLLPEAWPEPGGPDEEEEPPLAERPRGPQAR